jgi:hypothetical protein
MYKLCAKVVQQLYFVLKLEHLTVKYQENDMFPNYQYRLDHENQVVIHSNERYQNQLDCPKKTKLKRMI